MNQKLKAENMKTRNRIIRKNLDVIILLMLLEKPMCSKDIMERITKEFGICLSTGTLYPLLHSWTEIGLLECKPYVKRKVYSVADMEEALKIINEYMEANKYLMKLVESNILVEKRGEQEKILIFGEKEIVVE